MKRQLLVAILGIAVLTEGCGRTMADARPKSEAMPVVVLTAREDHQRIMDLLHIASLRPGAVWGKDYAGPNAPNYDEAKANPNPILPDPLVMNDGTKVTTPAQWWNQRRPEIVEAFGREIYGRIPAKIPAVTWTILGSVKGMEGTVATVTQTLLGRVDNTAFPRIEVGLRATLTLPADANERLPVMIELMAPPAPPKPGATPPTTELGPTSKQQVLAKGWGYAVLDVSSVQADNGAGLTLGIIGLCNEGKPRTLDDWGALRAWGWGASRLIDYLESDRRVDPKRIGLEGHSRYGKAALVAMADDPRVAIAYISSSGAGGAALLRRNFGEKLENVAGEREYHWMAGNFLKYAGPLTAADLPVDANELIALCAPRPVFIGGGSIKEDGWVDPPGMFKAAASAGSVYALLGRRGLGTNALPPPDTALIDGDIAFRQHTHGHTPGPNWPVFIEFADRYWK